MLKKGNNVYSAMKCSMFSVIFLSGKTTNKVRKFVLKVLIGKSMNKNENIQ